MRDPGTDPGCRRWYTLGEDGIATRAATCDRASVESNSACDEARGVGELIVAVLMAASFIA